MIAELEKFLGGQEKWVDCKTQHKSVTWGFKGQRKFPHGHGSCQKSVVAGSSWF